MSALRLDATRRLSTFLLAKGMELKISLFAEQFNEDDLAHADGSTVTVRDVARRLGAKHRFFEPVWTQRRLLRLHFDDRREAFWLWYLGDYLYTDTILFVCGVKHLHSVFAKLRARGVHATILPERWGAGLPHAEPVAPRERPRDQRRTA
jgi:hypothetical protein